MDGIIVLDNGSYSCKYGYAGFEKPLGKVRSTILSSNGTYISNINESALNIFSGTEMYYPIKNGVICDIEYMSNIWDYIFYEKMRIEPKDKKILVSVPKIDDKRYRKKILEIMFEKYNFSSCQVADQQILSLYGCGKNSGLVVDIGHDVTRVVPVIDSYNLSSGNIVSCLAGNTVNSYISRTTDKYYFNDELDKFKKYALKLVNRFNTEIKIKDSVVVYHNWDNILLDPYLMDLDCYSVPELIENSINKCDITTRKLLYENIVFSGGTSMVPTLCYKIVKRVKQKSGRKIKMLCPKNRSVLSWFGGSVLSCLPTFNSSWLKKDDINTIID